MRHIRLILMALFLMAALLSIWISPVFGLEQWNTNLGIADNAMTGEMIGRTLLQSGEALDIKVGSTPGIHAIEWILDGHMIGNSPDIHMDRLRKGEHLLSLTYRDFKDQLFVSTATIRVLDKESYAIQAGTLQEVMNLLLSEEDFQSYLPAIVR